ncbi:ribonucleotide-diphosphate reductase subunit alpha [Streptococcus equi subsp. equi]|nr:ribonucleotide-diphosphate reductase subunit alpha [Streptococcus equi subsp. equi]
MSLKDLGDISYFRLNNEINRPVDGSIPLHKDKEALEAFFTENVIPNTMSFSSINEKIAYLVDNDYIESAFIQNYSPEFISHLAKSIQAEGFRFKSFMAAYKFYQQYALKTNDGNFYLESIEDRVMFNALYFADGDETLAKDLAIEMINQRYQPATPSFLNAGRSRRGELVSCFLLQVTDDMNAIGRSINSALQLSRIGGGVGISLSNLREAGAPIKGYAGAASGVVPVMKLFEDSFSYSNQLGQRQGAGVVYLSVFHPDIIAFLSTKKKMQMKRCGSRHCHLVLLYQISFMSLLVTMLTCISLALIVLKENTACHLTTLILLACMTNWLPILISPKQKSKHVIWRQRFPSSSRNLAIPMLSTSTLPTGQTLLTVKSS